MEREIKIYKNKMLDEDLKEIERYEDVFNKCYQAIRKIDSYKPKKLLSIYDENFELVTSDDEQIEIIKTNFTKLISSDETVDPITPEKMTIRPNHPIHQMK